MSLTAVIPVRGGSTRIKDKNIRPFAGSSLLELKIEQLKRIPGIDEILISSDSDIMLEIGRRQRVLTAKRPDEYCDEKSRSFNEVVEYIASEEVHTEDMMWVPCVCPLLEDESIQRGLELFDKIKEGSLDADSVVSARILKEYVFDEKGPINFSVEHHVPSQHLPNWHTIQNGFFIARRADMEKWRFVYGPNPCLYEISKYEAIDIDDMIEYEMAEFLYKKLHNIM